MWQTWEKWSKYATRRSTRQQLRKDADRTVLGFLAVTFQKNTKINNFVHLLSPNDLRCWPTHAKTIGLNLLFVQGSCYMIDMFEVDTEDSSETKYPTAAYVSFKTFQSGVQSLRGHGLPERIDRSVWLSKSGADQTGLLSAFRFLGLIDSKNVVQPTLRKLVDVSEASASEKEILEGILRVSYAKLFDKLNLETITPTQFTEAIGEYGPTGSTRDRAERFFMKAAKYCDIKMSGRLTARKPRGIGTKTNGTSAQRNALRKTEDNTPTPPRTDPAAVAMKVVNLPHAGGSLTLSGTFNAFELAGKERQLVYDIIDKMKDFEAAQQEDAP